MFQGLFTRPRITGALRERVSLSLLKQLDLLHGPVQRLPKAGKVTKGLQVFRKAHLGTRSDALRTALTRNDEASTRFSSIKTEVRDCSCRSERRGLPLLCILLFGSGCVKDCDCTTIPPEHTALQQHVARNLKLTASKARVTPQPTQDPLEK